MADLDAAITYVLRNEDRRLSGVVTSDSGGNTRFGIAQKFHPDLDVSFYTIPKSQAMAMAMGIYKTEYALPLHLDQIKSQPIANKLLDIGVNCGVGVAVGMAQNGACDLGVHVEIDKHMGPATVAAINQVVPGALMGRLITLSQNYYRSTAIKTHASINELASWLTRAGKPGI